MAKAPRARNADRKNGKAFKKRPKIFDAIKRRLVTKKQLRWTIAQLAERGAVNSQVVGSNPTGPAKV